MYGKTYIELEANHYKFNHYKLRRVVKIKIHHNGHLHYIYIGTKRIGYSENQYGKYALKLINKSIKYKKRYLNYIVKDKNDSNISHIKIYNKLKNKYFDVLVDTKNVKIIQKVKWYIDINNKSGRIVVRGRYEERNVFLHRYIMNIINEEPSIYIDHIDRNTLNNLESNLRITNNSINQRNKGVQKNNTSGIPGVRFDKNINSWVSVYTDINGKRHTRTFSAKKYGYDEAKELAIKNRIENCKKNEYIGLNL